MPEVAVLLGDMSERNVWELIRRKQLPSFKSGGRRLVDHEDLRAYINRQKEAAA